MLHTTHTNRNINTLIKLSQLKQYKNKSKIRSIWLLICGLIFFSIFSPERVDAQNAYVKLCMQAIEFEKSGNLDAAINKYNEAINMKPEEWTGYSYRAKVKLRMAKYDDAITDISKAISLSPETKELYEIRANCLVAKGMYDKAIADYNMALSNVSANSKEIYLTYFQRGRAYFNTRQYQAAINDFNQAITSAQKFFLSPLA